VALSDEQRVRYARHLLLPELGESAQLRLLAGSVRFARGVAEGTKEVAGEYLRRAGVKVIEAEAAHAHGDVNVDGDGDVNVDAATLLLSPLPLSCAPELAEAAHAVAGAFAAVEAIKAIVGLGQAARLDRDLLSAEDV
jgi:hypothetical protein